MITGCRLWAGQGRKCSQAGMGVGSNRVIISNLGSKSVEQFFPWTVGDKSLLRLGLRDSRKTCLMRPWTKRHNWSPNWQHKKTKDRNGKNRTLN